MKWETFPKADKRVPPSIGSCSYDLGIFLSSAILNAVRYKRTAVELDDLVWAAENDCRTAIYHAIGSDGAKTADMPFAEVHDERLHWSEDLVSHFVAAKSQYLAHHSVRFSNLLHTSTLNSPYMVNDDTWHEWIQIDFGFTSLDLINYGQMDPLYSRIKWGQPMDKYVERTATIYKLMSPLDDGPLNLTIAVRELVSFNYEPAELIAEMQTIGA